MYSTIFGGNLTNKTLNGKALFFRVVENDSTIKDFATVGSLIDNIDRRNTHSINLLLFDADKLNQKEYSYKRMIHNKATEQLNQCIGKDVQKLINKYETRTRESLEELGIEPIDHYEFDEVVFIEVYIFRGLDATLKRIRYDLEHNTQIHKAYIDSIFS